MSSRATIILTVIFLFLMGCKATEKPDSEVITDNRIYGQQPILEPGVEFPKLKGGLKRVQRKLEYPQEARKNKVQGRVVVSFIVNKQGKAQDLKVDKGLGYGCDRAAVEAIQRASFEPARKNGKPVNFKFALPITFRLN